MNQPCSQGDLGGGGGGMGLKEFMKCNLKRHLWNDDM